MCQFALHAQSVFALKYMRIKICAVGFYFANRFSFLLFPCFDLVEVFVKKNPEKVEQVNRTFFSW
jgi:hypothetical protein